MTLSNPDFARHTARLFGYADEEAAKRDAVLLSYLNILMTSFLAKKAKVISPAEHKAHLTSFFNSVRGERVAMMRLLELPGYEEEFRDECRSFLLVDNAVARSSRG